MQMTVLGNVGGGERERVVAGEWGGEEKGKGQEALRDQARHFCWGGGKKGRKRRKAKESP